MVDDGKIGAAPEIPRSAEELEQERQDAAEAKARMTRSATQQSRLLMMSSLMCTVGASLLAVVLVPGPLAYGVVLGGLVMTANLYVLSLLLRKVLLQEENRGLYAIMLGSSFLGLAGASAWVVKTYPDMALGFGLGLSVPAMAGMVFSLFRRGRGVS